MTVADLKERMTADELSGWIAYANEMGPLNLAWRIELAVARAFGKLHGGKHVRDLMPWPKEPEQEATLENVMRELSKQRGE